MPKKFNITLCDGPACMHKRSKELEQAIELELTKHNIRKRSG